LGTVLLSVLAGHWRYAHITTLRCDPVNPRTCICHPQPLRNSENLCSTAHLPEDI
jgi:hypothetical protein